MDRVIEMLEDILDKLANIENRLDELEMNQSNYTVHDIDDVYEKLDGIENSIDDIEISISNID